MIESITIKSVKLTKPGQSDRSNQSVTPTEKVLKKKENKNNDENNDDDDDETEDKDDIEDSEEEDDDEVDDAENEVNPKEKRRIALQKLYKKYKKLFREQALKNRYQTTIPFIENDFPSLEEKIINLRKKITDANNDDELLFLSTYNPLGYSIKVPQAFKKKLDQSNLWYIHFDKNSLYEIQFFIGLSKESGVKLDELLQEIIKKYGKIGPILWKKPNSLNQNKLQQANALEGKEIYSIYKSRDYHNLIAIKVLKSLNKNIVTYIIGILSIKKQTGDFDELLEEQEEIFWKTYYSFAFL